MNLMARPSRNPQVCSKWIDSVVVPKAIRRSAERSAKAFRSRRQPHVCSEVPVMKFVVKLGGAALENPELLTTLCPFHHRALPATATSVAAGARRRRPAHPPARADGQKKRVRPPACASPTPKPATPP